MASLTCTEVEKGYETIIRSLFVKMDDGSYAVKTTTVTGGDPIDCDTAEPSAMSMLLGAVVNEGGEYVLQIQAAS
jgi:hypothetical protein